MRAPLRARIRPAESFGRIHHLPEKSLAGVMGGLRARGLIDQGGQLTDHGRATKARIESMTDALAEPPYHALTGPELEELIDHLQPISRHLSESDEIHT